MIERRLRRARAARSPRRSARRPRSSTSGSIRRRSTTTREAAFAAEVAEALVGRDNVVRNLDAVDGLRGLLVHAAGEARARSPGWGRAAPRAAASCTTARYDFNDAVIPLGAGYLAALAERAMPLAATGRDPS